MDDFQLHSHGDNWFHFRKHLDSAMESFSVTYCHDGTVCMTGDYGCLCWQRSFFPEKLDYGFPNKQSGIGYFAQKVVRAEQDQNIKTWKKDLAIREITESIEQRKSENPPSQVLDIEILTLQHVLDELDYFEDGDYGYIQMLEAFSKTETRIEPETYHGYGRCYTDAFVQRYEKLISVSDMILEHVNLALAEPIGMYATGKYLIVDRGSNIQILDTAILKEVADIKDKDNVKKIRSACEYAATKTDPTFAAFIEKMIARCLVT